MYLLIVTFYSYKRHISIHHPKEILDIDTFLKLRSEVLNKSSNYHAEDDDEVGLDEALQVEESSELDAPPGMLPTMVNKFILLKH